jgi:hypothetical protein
MNPYLEQDEVWPDFHHHFLTLLAESLVAQVRPNYIVKVEEHLYVHELSAEERLRFGRADVAIKRPAAHSTSAGSAVPVAQTAPHYGRLPIATDVERQGFLQVQDRRTREVVAMIEVISPSNKRMGADREQYLGKRQHVLSSAAHLVEIDLLRGGPRLPIEDLPDCDYYALVSHAEERPSVGIWPVRLRDRLPEIPVPLRPPHGDARIDLQRTLHRVYDTFGYEDYIYSGTPQPPLSPEDAAWAEAMAPRSG